MNLDVIECKHCGRTANIIDFANADFQSCPYCGSMDVKIKPDISPFSPHPEIFTALDSHQMEAAFATEGVVRVIAGAGSGKTAVLIHRIALIANVFRCACSIFAITFTKKAANEMKERLSKLMNMPAYVNTIHGLCHEILDKEAIRIGFAGFQIMDTNYKKVVLGDIFEKLELEKAFFTQDELICEFSKMKLNKPDYYIEMLCGKTAEELDNAIDSETELKNKAFLCYLRQQRILNSLDFDDLIIVTLHVLKSYPAALDYWQNRIRYMHVDEFQDISKNEFELIRLLSEKHGNLFVVGDPDQNIYTWRGSCLEYLNHFNEYFPVHRSFILNYNYRSVPAVINTSNILIQNNVNRVPKLAVPVRSETNCVRVHRANDSFDEAEYIAKEIKLKMQYFNGLSLSDFGILYRSSCELRFIETALRKYCLPYHAPCDISFFDKKEICIVHSYLRFMACKDDASFLCIIKAPKRGIGKGKMELLKTYAKDNKVSLYEALTALQDSDKFKKTSAKEFIAMVEAVTPVFNNMSILNLIEKILCVSGYEEWLSAKGQSEEIANINELKRMIADYEREEDMPVNEYLKIIALYGEK
ncbi:MAG: UvrD-helicase domain-containing protein, partial [Alphaproteobacteria bacterium]|nr:UvrD-helicase domain-containing protein [Alphaproteobacteria bacterium]